MRNAAVLVLLLFACGSEPQSIEIRCGDGTIEQNQVCVPEGTEGGLVCGAGTAAIDGRCVPSEVLACGPGTERVDDLCVVASVPLPTLAPGITEIAGIDPELDHADLAPLSAMVSQAAVVALGESIHTSGGYYQAKHRLFRYLVEVEGFRVYAFESPWTDADLVADYVAGCIDGSSTNTARNVVLGGLFGVWAGEETLALVEWMCSYNTEHPSDPVSFFGFDIQQPWYDGAALARFVTLTATNAASLRSGFEICDGATAASAADYYASIDLTVPLPVADNAACLDGLDAVDRFFTQNEATIIEATSATDLEMARIRLTGLRSWQGEIFYYTRNSGLSLQARDEGMAYTFQKLLELRAPVGTRAVIWAHNTHIAAQQHLVEGPYAGGRSMGTFLSEALGAAYVPIGLIGYNVSIDWPNVGVGPRPVPTRADDVEVMLHAFERPYLMVDLTRAELFDPQTAYGLQGERMEPAAQFRGLLFLDRSPSMRPLNW